MSEHAPDRPEERRQRAASDYSFRAIPTVMAELQRALLPATVPVLPRARIAARYQAARDSDAAGGNWFDAIPLGDGALVLAVGDVPGCGVGAAAAMGRLRTVLGDQLAAGADLMSALRWTDSFAQRTPELLAATVVLAKLNPADGSLAYVTCGHPPPLVVSAAGGTRYLATTGGGPLGTGSELTASSAVLQPEDCMLLYTEGLIQRHGSTVAEGMTELALAAPEALANRALRPGQASGRQQGHAPDRLCRRTVELMSRGGYPDDVTTLAVQLDAVPAADLDLTLPAEETSVLRVRRAFAEWLTDIDAGVQDKDDLMLAVVETVTNAVEHAYPPGSRGSVEFRAALEKDGMLECRVTDHGRWRPPEPVTGYRGHGLMVAGQVVDHMRVSIDETSGHAAGSGGTVVTLRHRLGRPPSISTDARAAGDRSEPVSFSLDLDSDGDVPRAMVSGPVTGSSADRLAQRLLAACRGGVLPIIVDMSGITYLASSAIRAIYEVKGLLAAHKQNLTIFAPAGSAAAALLDLVQLPHVTGRMPETEPG